MVVIWVILVVQVVVLVQAVVVVVSVTGDSVAGQGEHDEEDAHQRRGLVGRLLALQTQQQQHVSTRDTLTHPSYPTQPQPYHGHDAGASYDGQDSQVFAHRIPRSAQEEGADHHRHHLA